MGRGPVIANHLPSRIDRGDERAQVEVLIQEVRPRQKQIGVPGQGPVAPQRGLRSDLHPGPALVVDHGIRQLDRSNDRSHERSSLLGGDPIDVPGEHEEERQEQAGQEPHAPRLAAVGAARPAQHGGQHSTGENFRSHLYVVPAWWLWHEADMAVQAPRPRASMRATQGWRTLLATMCALRINGGNVYAARRSHIIPHGPGLASTSIWVHAPSSSTPPCFYFR